MLSQLLNELTCWVDCSMSQVVEFHVSFYAVSHFLNHDSQLYTQSGSLIITLIIYSTEILIITSFFFFLNTSSLNLFKWKYIIVFSFLTVIFSNNHLHTVKEINTLNHSSIIFCHYCFFYLYLYIIMNNYKKCVKYIYCECFCISVLWETFNKVCDKFELNILKMKFKQS